jgi:hypothetical protein
VPVTPGQAAGNTAPPALPVMETFAVDGCLASGRVCDAPLWWCCPHGDALPPAEGSGLQGIVQTEPGADQFSTPVARTGQTNSSAPPAHRRSDTPPTPGQSLQ